MSEKINKINWESWNVKEEDLIKKAEKQERDYLKQIQSPEGPMFEDQTEDGDTIFSMPAPIVTTPFGDYMADSVFKPSNRWECWICYTNFPITEDIVNSLNEDIEGIEALSILGAYTFCIGVAKMFDASEVKREIEEKFCT
jgi:hypothetical protein